MIINHTAYNRYYLKGNKILKKLKKEIDTKGYRENMGQKQARKFDDEVMKAFTEDKLTYEEAANLSMMLYKGVLNL